MGRRRSPIPKGDRIVVVGCSVGGSCALELAALAPDRIAALVLIGTKADHRPEPALRSSAIATSREKGVNEAWRVYWEPLISTAASDDVIDDLKRMALRQSVEDLARGVSVFHSRPSRGSVLSEFANPIVDVTGADNIAPGPATTVAQASMARRGQLHIVPQCGHYVPIEQPRALNAILSAVISALR